MNGDSLVWVVMLHGCMLDDGNRALTMDILNEVQILE